MASRKLNHIRIEPAEGGAISETHFEAKRSGQGGGPSFDHESERVIHPTLEHLHAHVAKHMAPHFGEEEGEKKEPAKHEGKEDDAGYEY